MTRSSKSLIIHMLDALSKKDIQSNSTLQSLEQLNRPITHLYSNKKEINTLVDIGCGRGGFAWTLGDAFNSTSIFGIDTNESKLAIACERGISTSNIDIELEPLPYDDNYVDFVMAFGLFEHLTDYDHPLEEIHRVLRDDGWFWITVPNLGGWTNRLALLLGYQPRNVEVSSQKSVGILPFYDYNKPLGHVHAPTYRALVELLEHHGFSIEIVTPLSPYQDSFAVKAVDAVLGRSPRFSRRVSILCRKQA
ncbi:class I SAM-dependent methyltransferase [Natrialbaceae archaeon A-chndr2]